MFTVTSAAALQIQQTATTSGAQGMVLRIAARVDADGSMQYGMGFDDPKDEDMKLELEGVSVVIADEYQELLTDTVLDFVELNPGEFNFIFIDGHQVPDAPEQAPGSGCSASGCSGGGCGGKGLGH
jgi:iron-sulfur cluster assembly protein